MTMYMDRFGYLGTDERMKLLAKERLCKRVLSLEISIECLAGILAG